MVVRRLRESGSEKKGSQIRKCCRAGKLTRGTTFFGSWSTWDGEGRGKRRSKTLKVASKCKRGESPQFSKETVEAARGGTPDGPGRTQGRTGRKQAMCFLLPLDGKTLEHTKTT
jgi:hypothetical protein